MMYIRVDGGTAASSEHAVVVTGDSDKVEGRENVSSSTTASFPSGRIDLDRSCCLREHTMVFAPTCSAMFRRRPRGSVGSISTMVAPAFMTARTATTVHLDFSKHTGTKSFSSTPDSA